jgi:hypothetical protein
MTQATSSAQNAHLPDHHSLETMKGRHQVLRRGVSAQRPEGHNLTPPGSCRPKAPRSTVRFVVRLAFPPDRPVRRPANPLDSPPEGSPSPNQVPRRSPRPAGQSARGLASHGPDRPEAFQPAGPLGPKAARSFGRPARRPAVPEPGSPKVASPGRPVLPKAPWSRIVRPEGLPIRRSTARRLPISGSTRPKACRPLERRVFGPPSSRTLGPRAFRSARLRVREPFALRGTIEPKTALCNQKIPENFNFLWIACRMFCGQLGKPPCPRGMGRDNISGPDTGSGPVPTHFPA